MKEVTAKHVAQLRSKLSEHGYDASKHNDIELEVFLKVNKDIEATAKAIIEATEHLENLEPITIADVAEFHRSPPGEKYPHGCIFLLEDMKGGVARDNKGRPIAVSIGMQWGTKEENLLQVRYLHQRMLLYTRPEDVPYQKCIIFEVVPREKKGKATFRIPDATLKSTLEFLQKYMPGAQLSISHMCGVSKLMTGGFHLSKPFLTKETYERTIMKPDFSHLIKENYISPENCLKTWDKSGTLELDIDAYVDWRAKEEGVLDKVCRKGQGRRFGS